MSIVYLHDQFARDNADGFRLRVLSTFSGIGAASVSWSPADFEFVGYAEPAAFPAHVLHYRRSASRPRYLPDGFKQADCATLPADGVPNFGDITQISDDDLRALGTVDVLEGGSPCQAFSIAGARKGLEDARGNLLLAFCRLAERMRDINDLEYVVWENVHGVLSDKTNGFGCLLAALAGESGGPLQSPGRKWSNAGRVHGPKGRQVAWRTIEADSWGIPQRRKRVFVVASLRKSATGIGSASEILFNTNGTQWSAEKGFPTRQAVVATYRGGGGLEYRSAEDRMNAPAVQQRLKAERNVYWLDSVGFKVKATDPIQTSDTLVHPKISATLCASGAGVSRPAGMGSELDFVVITRRNENPKEWNVRRFTPLECERLQGFPDFWTDVPFKGKLPSDSLRYRAIGNSMPCPVMSWIGHQLELYAYMERFAEAPSHLVEGTQKRGRGRPSKNGVAMTNAERQRHHRERRKASKQAVDDPA